MKRRIIGILCAIIALGGVIGMVQQGRGEEISCQAEFDMGIRHLRDGRYEEAVSMFTQAIAIDPDYGPAYYYRANTYQAMAEGCADFRKRAEYLEHAEQDYICAGELDPALSSDAKGKLEELASMQNRLIQGTFSGLIPDPVLPETDSANVEETKPVEETVSTKEPQVIPTEPGGFTAGGGKPGNDRQELPDDRNFGIGLTDPTVRDAPGKTADPFAKRDPWTVIR